MRKIVKINRRKFLKITAVAGGGLVIGISLHKLIKRLPSSSLASDRIFGNFGIYLKIGTDEKITIAIPKSEMGQGITTSLSMIIADELGAEWSKVRTEWPPLHPVYGSQGTGASRSVRDLWEPFRLAGAIARTMLISAAAKIWNIKETSCYAENSEVVNSQNGKRLSFGNLSNSASQLKIPKKVILKNPVNFKFIGKEILSLEAEDMVTGKTVYGYDVRVPGMLTAVIERCPVFGGSVKSFDERKALSLGGVKFVVPVITPKYDKFTRDFLGKDFLIETIGEDRLKKVYRFAKRKYNKTLRSIKKPRPTGIAVVGEDYWSVEKGRRALNIKWDEGKNAELSSERIVELFKNMEVKQTGEQIVNSGDVEKGINDSVKVIESTYTVPFLAHAPMEPMNCTADVRDGRCEIWVPTQTPMDALNIAEQYSNIPKKRIKINKTVIGGSFGRRQHNDFVAEAVQVSKAVGAPVKILWTREDDMQHDFYRPATYNKLKAGLNDKGMPVFWQHRIVGKGTDVQLIVGINDTPYNILNKKVELIRKRKLIPSGPFRGVAGSQNTFITESFIDELAFEGGIDPFGMRYKLLEDEPRYIKVLGKIAELADWGHPLKKGRYQGISLCTHNGTVISQIAEVSLGEYNATKVHRVFCTVDCGRVINPLAAKNQIEGGIIYGLGQVLKHQITIKRGRVEQGNFHDYQMARMDEVPDIKIHFINSGEKPTGIGEVGAMPIVPAVTNAIFAATGRRIKKLPIFVS
ncbi:MAG: xanthine dehydrogenase family protein molybdopterin-binding subunit [Deltaproteobacteria bacterium]|nr:xanthine dehydrogenase family protein molybdopterin-binding subunit [Deltaproteobacteria bacterium]